MMTLKRVAKLVHAGVVGRYRDDGTSRVVGLYLCVTGKDRAHFELRYQLNGRSRWMGLGRIQDIDLLQVRERARQQRMKLLDGTDPLEARRAERANRAAATAMTFEQAAKAFLEAHQAKWRSPKHSQQWVTSLRRHAFPILGGLDVRLIDVPQVLKVLEQKVEATGRYPAGTLWKARPVSADRLRNRIELILAWCTARKYRAGDNPASWSVLRHVLPSVTSQGAHHAAIPYAQIPLLMAKLQEQEGVAAMALRFLILTAARTGEALDATHGEIDTAEAMWTIPGPRMKSGR